MFSYRSAVNLGLGVAVVAMASCSGDRAQGPGVEGGPMLSSVSGTAVSEGVMRQQLTEATRLVALALGSPAVRAQLKQALDASPYREHKLHFSTFVRGSGRGLLAGMAAGRKRSTESDMLAALDSLIDAELYIPVPDHRGRWRGGKDLIVASALRDHEIPVAFDLDGNPVTLTSAVVPPATPTLALVPAETNFGSGLRADEMMLECEGTCDPGDAGSGGYTVGGGTGGGSGNAGSGASPSVSAAVQALGGVVMTFVDIPGSYEGFLMGNPEFEVHAMGVAADGTLRDNQCAGEHAATAIDQPGVKSGAYVYDQNAEGWSGSVTLLSQAQAQMVQASGDPVVYWIWEDDNTECKIISDSSFVSTVLRGTTDLLSHGLNSIKALFNPDSLSPRKVVKAVSNIISGFQNDDVVGFLVPAAEAGQSWPDANYAIVFKRADGTLEVRGRANLVPISP